MTERAIDFACADGIAGFLSFAVTGLRLVFGYRPRFSLGSGAVDALLHLATSRVFRFSSSGFVWRRSAIVLAILALAFVIVYAVLSWRHCASFGYCTGVASIVLHRGQNETALAFLGTAISTLTAMVVENAAQGTVENLIVALSWAWEIQVRAIPGLKIETGRTRHCAQIKVWQHQCGPEGSHYRRSRDRASSF